MAHTQSSRLAWYGSAALALNLLAACQPDPGPVLDSDRLTALLETATFSGLEDFPDSVTLTGGKWEGEPYVEGGNTWPGVYLARPVTATGDLDGDGDLDVVTALVTASGGSGSFYHLVALRQDGDGLEHFASYFLGDRLKIPSLEIVDGGVNAEMLIHAEGDAMCCPTQRVDRRFELDGETIVLANEHMAESLERVFGFLVWGHENRSFSTCSGDREGWAIDSIQRHSLADLWAEFASEPYEPVFVDVNARWLGRSVDGFGEQFDDAIEITDIYRVEREGWGCRLDVNDVIFRGFGNEPSWRLDVRPDGAVITAPDAEEPMVWTGDGQLSNQQWEFDNDGTTLGISYLKIPCRDSMSGSWFSHQAEFRLGQSTVKGCAVPGMLDERR